MNWLIENYRRQRVQSDREDFVDEFVELEQEKIWDAYLSIDVSAKDGSEKVPKELLEKLKETGQYLDLEEYFNSCGEKEVYLTDDMISLNEQHDLYTVVSSILCKTIDVHLRVAIDKIEDIEKYLEEIVEIYASRIHAIINWKYTDDGYMIQLEKRLERFKERIIRLYPEGSGVIIKIENEDYKATYFNIPEEWLNIYGPKIENKIRSIISKPEYYSEDDRYFGFPVVLWYGVIAVDEKAYDKLNEYQRFESQEFADDEYEFEIMKALFSIDEIKAIWEEF